MIFSNLTNGGGNYEPSSYSFERWRKAFSALVLASIAATLVAACEKADGTPQRAPSREQADSAVTTIHITAEEDWGDTIYYQR